MRCASPLVMPAKAGIHFAFRRFAIGRARRIPAFAGMTVDTQCGAAGAGRAA